jgi:pyrroloquinoline quinone (PQQ) biosynthesis protein C
MEEARERFAASGRKSLAQWAAQKAREEAGHDRLALLDIQSMGYEAEAAVQALVPSAATALVDYFTQSVQAPDPIDCVGCSYASERLGTFQGEEYIQSVEALLPLGTHATRWLRVHSGVGAEVKHVEETVEVVAELTPEERIRVARACYETALLRFNPPKEGYISDEELQRILKPLESRTRLKAKSNCQPLTK